MNMDHFCVLLKNAGLDRVVEEIARVSMPCVNITAFPAEDAVIPIGASKLGGLPDVPVNFQWPMWNDKPLAFLAQFNLAEVASTECARPLPGSGMLSFFYEVEGPWASPPSEYLGAWRVFYFSPGELHRTSLHKDLADDAHFKACAVDFAEGISIPDIYSPEVDFLHLTEDETHSLFDLKHDDFVPDHQLLGLPNQLQNEMQTDCTSAFGEPDSNASTWLLLFQCGTDDNPKKWDDVGRLYFWIREKDLAARRFDEVWMVLQSS